MIKEPTPTVRANLADHLTEAGAALARLSEFWITEGIDDDYVLAFGEFWPFSGSIDECAAELEKIAEDLRASIEDERNAGEHVERA